MSRAAAASKWSVEHKTLAWFTGAAVILLLVLACAFVTARGLVDSAKEVRHSLLILSAYDRLSAQFSEVVSSQRAYIGTGNVEYLAQRMQAQAGVNDVMRLLRERIPESALERRRALEELSGAMDQDIAWLTAFDQNPANAADGFWSETESLTAHVRHDIETARAVEHALYESNLHTARKGASQLYILVALVAASLLAVLGSLLWRISCDLRERREVEHHLQQANHFLESLLESIPAMIFAKDAQDLRFVRFNRTGERLIGRSREELIGKSDRELFPPSQAEAFIAKDREVLAQGDIVSIPEEEIDTRAGRRVLHTYKVPVRDEHGTAKLLLGISVDITERKAAEQRIVALNQELMRQARMLQSSNEELESFCYSVSHDLRAPLRAINGYARLLQDEYGPQFDVDGARFLRTICRACDRMSRLIDDLLEFSRIGRQTLEDDLVDMNAVVRRVIGEALGGRAPPLPQIDLGELPPAHGDRNMLHLAWLNLIDNAVKYSSAVEHARISILSETTPTELVYSVSDNGIGFDMQYADKLFGVFQRLHSNTQYPGTGVGLAIAQRIIARHGGRIWAHSQPGRGATFSFALPRNGMNRTAVEDVKQM